MELSVVGQDQAPEYVPLREVAQRLHIETGRLALMSRQGKFPALLRVSQKHYLVRSDELAAWLESRRTTTDAVRDAAAAPARTRKATRDAAAAPARTRKATKGKARKAVAR